MPTHRLALPALAAALLLSACGGGADKPVRAGSATLPSTPCGTDGGGACAPLKDRVDRRMPVFSRPTAITNPLFPISRLRSVVLLGHVDGRPFRTETTLLPGSDTVVWNGRRVQTLVSQYMAYLDGRITEVALDRYAQSDDGAVWYFGEDVFDYRRGSVAATEGTWQAGREGPAAMIMPAKPALGDVYRTENAPGVVFEEVTIRAVGRTVAGPRGAVHGAFVASELHQDGAREDKIYAPGYGEFRTDDGGDLEALALAVPTDALRRPVPPALLVASTSAEALIEAVRLRDWGGVRRTHELLVSAWADLRSAAQPPLIAARVREVLARLARAVSRREARACLQAALDVAQPLLDLRLRHVPAATVDAERLHLWTQQLRVDAGAHGADAVAGDVATIEWIRDRTAHTLAPGARDELDVRIRSLRSASDARNLASAADQAARLGARIRVLAV